MRQKGIVFFIYVLFMIPPFPTSNVKSNEFGEISKRIAAVE